MGERDNFPAEASEDAKEPEEAADAEERATDQCHTEQRDTEPAPPERSTFRRGDHEIHLFRWPKPGAHRLLLVHGIGMGHEVYDRFVSTAHHEADVICVDLPGFGDSPEPAEALSMQGTADLLAECIREQGLAPLTAVGHSMGAQVVAGLAARHPELLECLVLVAPTVNRHERTANKQALRILQDLTNNSPAVFARGLVAYLCTGPRWYVKKLGPTLDHRIEDCLPNIELRTLVLRGENDAVSPRDWALEVTALLPHAELRELKDRGHEALISSGEPAARLVLDWIAAGDPSPGQATRAQ